jgi:drug/metabolite transporter (DMT)-like permease
MTNQKKGLLLVFSTAVISGISIFLNGLSVKMIDPSAFTFLKNSIVALLLFGLIIGTIKRNELFHLNKKNWLYLCIIGLIGGCIPFLLFFNGLKMIGADAGAFLHKTMFIYVAIFAFFFLKEKVSGKWLIFASAVLLLSNFLLSKASFAPFNAGYLFVIGATIFWAVENVFSKKLLNDGMEPMVLAFGRMFFGSLLMLGFLSATNNLGPAMTMSGQQWLWTLIPAGMLMLYVLTWYTGLKSVPVTTASIILLIGAPITTLMNLAILNKGLSLQETYGLILAAISIHLILNKKKLSPPPVNPATGN